MVKKTVFNDNIIYKLPKNCGENLFLHLCTFKTPIFYYSN